MSFLSMDVIRYHILPWRTEIMKYDAKEKFIIVFINNYKVMKKYTRLFISSESAMLNNWGYYRYVLPDSIYSIYEDFQIERITNTLDNMRILHERRDLKKLPTFNFLKEFNNISQYYYYPYNSQEELINKAALYVTMIDTNTFKTEHFRECFYHVNNANENIEYFIIEIEQLKKIAELLLSLN